MLRLRLTHFLEMQIKVRKKKETTTDIIIHQTDIFPVDAAD
jgi:hypothetical protein